MTISHITIEDIDIANGEIKTTVTYDIDEDADKNDPITPAALYGYVVNYLFITGKIHDFVDEAAAHLNTALTDDEAEDNG